MPVWRPCHSGHFLHTTDNMDHGLAGQYHVVHKIRHQLLMSIRQKINTSLDPFMDPVKCLEKMESRTETDMFIMTKEIFM